VCEGLQTARRGGASESEAQRRPALALHPTDNVILSSEPNSTGQITQCGNDVVDGSSKVLSPHISRRRPAHWHTHLKDGCVLGVSTGVTVLLPPAPGEALGQETPHIKFASDTTHTRMTRARGYASIIARVCACCEGWQVVFGQTRARHTSKGRGCSVSGKIDVRYSSRGGSSTDG